MKNHLLYGLVIAALAVPAISIGGSDKLKQDLGGMKLQVQSNTSVNAGGAGMVSAAPAIDGVSVTNNDRVAARCALLGPKEALSGTSGQVIAPGESATLRIESGTVDTTASTALRCSPAKK